ncbi:Outer membrane receptor proteins, mostly Fe transport [Ekhidna lutea]|uniref:Outer membrane receptor proteins, mostly Fe transport n=1 Tax=Ekhidna lutea TaxID=447679 RepID=A0A239M2X1_EKHLU|nr:TonB-dependent receptor [Ekhidna lutea]SNT36940.1 Outer membrane receptor proteins, mostly Fe transport [Ekhidna lutea]
MRTLTTSIILLLTIASFAQQSFEVSAENESLTTVIKSLSKAYNLKFSYSPRVLSKHKVTLRIKAKSQAELISKVFENLPFELKLTDGVYLIIPKKEEPKQTPIIGQVYDGSSGEPLAYAHVQTKDKGTLSSQNGRFSLPPSRDTITLSVSYIGYKNIELKVPPNEENLTLKLDQNPQELQEVVLTAESDNFNPDPSFFSLNPQQFSSLPMLGETDVFKTLQLLPGVRATDETSSGLVVRGSLPSQNLVLMDGFTLYNLDHFFGIFSTLNPNAINNIDFYKGGFGPQFGGRVSSVIDVAGKNGAVEKFGGQVGLNMLSFNTTFNIPFGSKTSALIAFRQSFTDVVNSDLYQDFLTSSRQNYLESISSELTALNLSPSLQFHDINAKVQHRFSERSIFDVNFYVSEDFYAGNYQESNDFAEYVVLDESNWANAGISFNLKSQFRPNWFNSTTLSASEYREDESLSITQTFFQDIAFDGDSIEANESIEYFNYSIGSSVGDVTIKSHNEIDIDHQNTLSGGVEINAINTDYETRQSYLVNLATTEGYTDTLTIEASIFSLYGNYRFHKEDITANIGIRSSYYEPTDKWYVEPRFDMGIKISDQFALKGAASFHHQFITQTSLSILQNSDQFYWILADDKIIPVQRSAHFIFGGNYAFNDNWSVDLEYYNKRTEGIIESQFLVLPPEIIELLLEQNLNLSGENNAEGMDLFVKYRIKTFTSMLSYSLGRSENSFWYRNQNNDYPSVQDQRHELNFTNILKLGKWELSSVYLLGTGQRYTPANPEYSLENDSDSFYDLTRINQEKLPAYKRLDLSAKYNFNIGSLSCESGVTLFNLLNNKNIKSRKLTVRYVFDEQTDASNATDELEVVPLDTHLLGFTPNFFFNIRF